MKCSYLLLKDQNPVLLDILLRGISVHHQQELPNDDRKVQHPFVDPRHIHPALQDGVVEVVVI